MEAEVPAGSALVKMDVVVFNGDRPESLVSGQVIARHLDCRLIGTFSIRKGAYHIEVSSDFGVSVTAYGVFGGPYETPVIPSHTPRCG